MTGSETQNHGSAPSDQPVEYLTTKDFRGADTCATAAEDIFQVPLPSLLKQQQAVPHLQVEQPAPFKLTATLDHRPITDDSNNSLQQCLHNSAKGPQLPAPIWYESPPAHETLLTQLNAPASTSLLHGTAQPQSFRIMHEHLLSGEPPSREFLAMECQSPIIASQQQCALHGEQETGIVSGSVEPAGKSAHIVHVPVSHQEGQVLSTPQPVSRQHSGTVSAGDPEEPAGQGADLCGTDGEVQDTDGNSEDTEQEWWRPQPHPSLDDQHVEMRPAQRLAQALSCHLCKDLLREAITAPGCGHSFCYECIDEHLLVDGSHGNRCPICQDVLGINPFESRKLLYDFTLDALVRKIFPRPELDALLERRRVEREEATREAKAAMGKRGAVVLPRDSPHASKRPRHSQQQPGSTSDSEHEGAGDGKGAEEEMLIALFPERAGGLATLSRPYVVLSTATSIATLSNWLAGQLRGTSALAVEAVADVQLHCRGRCLGPEGTLKAVLEGQQPATDCGRIPLLISYSIKA